MGNILSVPSYRVTQQEAKPLQTNGLARLTVQNEARHVTYETRYISNGTQETSRGSCCENSFKLCVLLDTVDEIVSGIITVRLFNFQSGTSARQRRCAKCKMYARTFLQTPGTIARASAGQWLPVFGIPAMTPRKTAQHDPTASHRIPPLII